MRCIHRDLCRQCGIPITWICWAPVCQLGRHLPEVHVVRWLRAAWKGRRKSGGRNKGERCWHPASFYVDKHPFTKEAKHKPGATSAVSCALCNASLHSAPLTNQPSNRMACTCTQVRPHRQVSARAAWLHCAAPSVPARSNTRLHGSLLGPLSVSRAPSVASCWMLPLQRPQAGAQLLPAGAAATSACRFRPLRYLQAERRQHSCKAGPCRCGLHVRRMSSPERAKASRAGAHQPPL